MKNQLKTAVKRRERLLFLFLFFLAGISAMRADDLVRDDSDIKLDTEFTTSKNVMTFIPAVDGILTVNFKPQVLKGEYFLFSDAAHKNASAIVAEKYSTTSNGSLSTFNVEANTIYYFYYYDMLNPKTVTFSLEVPKPEPEIKDLSLESIAPAPGQKFDSETYPNGLTLTFNQGGVKYGKSYFIYTGKDGWESEIAIDNVSLTDATMKIDFSTILEEARMNAEEDCNFEILVEGINIEGHFLCESKIADGVEINKDNGNLILTYQFDYVSDESVPGVTHGSDIKLATPFTTGPEVLKFIPTVDGILTVTINPQVLKDEYFLYSDAEHTKDSAIKAERYQTISNGSVSTFTVEAYTTYYFYYYDKLNSKTVTFSLEAISGPREKIVSVETITPKPAQVFDSGLYLDGIQIEFYPEEVSYGNVYFVYNNKNTNEEVKTLMTLYTDAEGYERDAVFMVDGVLRVNINPYLKEARENADPDANFQILVEGINSDDVKLSESLVTNGVEINAETGDLTLSYKFGLLPELVSTSFPDKFYRYWGENVDEGIVTLEFNQPVKSVSEVLIMDGRQVWGSESSGENPVTTFTVKPKISGNKVTIDLRGVSRTFTESTVTMFINYVKTESGVCLFDNSTVYTKYFTYVNESIAGESGNPADEFELVELGKTYQITVAKVLKLYIPVQTGGTLFVRYQNIPSNCLYTTPTLSAQVQGTHNSTAQQWTYTLEAGKTYYLVTPAGNTGKIMMGTKDIVLQDPEEDNRIPLQLVNITPTPRDAFDFNSYSEIWMEFDPNKGISCENIEVIYESNEGTVTIPGEEINATLGTDGKKWYVNFVNLPNIFNGIGSTAGYPAMKGEDFTIKLSGFHVNDTEANLESDYADAEGNLVFSYVYDRYYGMIKPVGDIKWPEYIGRGGAYPNAPVVIEYDAPIQFSDITDIEVWGQYTEDMGGSEILETTPTYDMVPYSKIDGNKLTIDFNAPDYRYNCLPGQDKMTVVVKNLTGLDGKPVGPILAHILHKDLVTGVSVIPENAENGYVVYNAAGVQILNTQDKTELNMLEPGLYIINGKKVLIRK